VYKYIWKEGQRNHKLYSERKDTFAAIYARVSSPNQANNGYSLDEQIRICHERCDLMGWKVRYIFKEDGESASTIDRPKFKMMLERARDGAFDVLVFWKLDRFCRSLADVVNIQRELEEYGASLHSVTEQIDTTTPVGKFNFRNLASASELERDLIKERARMGMHGLAREHKWPNPHPPLGYDKDADHRLRVNKEEAKWTVNQPSSSFPEPVISDHPYENSASRCTYG
jgi:site-specific DNA recombinase